VAISDQHAPGTGRSHDERLSAAQRTRVLDHEIQVLSLSGYHVEARLDHHVVMGSDRAAMPTLRLFVDEFGDAHRS
jgi:hypothetical protein